MTDADAEARAILTRAATVEAERQAAIARGDYSAVREHEQELSRLHSRHCDLQRQHDAA